MRRWILVCCLGVLLAIWLGASLFRGGEGPHQHPPARPSATPPVLVSTKAPTGSATFDVPLRLIDARGHGPLEREAGSFSMKVLPPPLALEGNRYGWTVTVVAQQPYEVDITNAPATRHGHLTLVAEDARPWDVLIHQGGVAVLVSVVDGATGRPLSGASVRLQALPSRKDVSNVSPSPSTTNADGRVELSVPHTDGGTSYRMIVDAPGHETAVVPIVAAKQRYLVFLWQASERRIHVRSESGQAIEGATIWARSGSGARAADLELGRTDKDGDCVCTSVHPRTPDEGVALRVAAEGYVSRVVPSVTFQPHGLDVRLRPDENASFGVTVVGAEGQPISGALVRVTDLRQGRGLRMGAAHVLAGPSPASGRVALTQISDGAVYVVDVRRGAHSTSIQRVFDAASLMTFPRVALPDESPLEVLVESSQGRPVVGARIYGRDSHEGNGTTHPAYHLGGSDLLAVTDDDGLAIVRQPSMRKLNLTVVRPGFAPHGLVTEGSQRVRVVLVPGGTIVLRVRDQDGQPVEGARAVLSAPARDDQGRWIRLPSRSLAPMAQVAVTDAEGQARLFAVSPQQALHIALGRSVADVAKLPLVSLEARPLTVTLHRRRLVRVALVDEAPQPRQGGMEGISLFAYVPGIAESRSSPRLTADDGTVEILLPSVPVGQAAQTVRVGVRGGVPGISDVRMERGQDRLRVPIRAWTAPTKMRVRWGPPSPADETPLRGARIDILPRGGGNGRPWASTFLARESDEASLALNRSSVQELVLRVTPRDGLPIEMAIPPGTSPVVKLTGARFVPIPVSNTGGTVARVTFRDLASGYMYDTPFLPPGSSRRVWVARGARFGVSDALRPASATDNPPQFVRKGEAQAGALSVTVEDGRVQVIR